MMTEKEFLALAPREQDAVVAEKVMGWTLELRKYVWEDPSEFYRSDHADFHDGRCIPITGASGYLRPYTTDISAAWEVVEKMRKDFWCRFEVSGGEADWDGTDPENFYAEFFAGDDNAAWKATTNVQAWASTAPLAICIAALKAVGEIHD